MENKKKYILQEWLKIDYYKISNKMKFTDKKMEVNYELLLDTIRCLDYLSLNKQKDNKEYIITIVALMWEYTDKDKYDLRDIIIKVLSRIGYATSAIIIDDEFNKNECKFFRPTSIFNMLAIAIEQSYNEVMIKEKSFLLTEFQKKIWSCMDNNKIIGISAPTSAGKSFVILIKSILKMEMDKCDIVYIVPTLSLLNQVTEDYDKMLKVLGISNYKICNGFEKETKDDINVVYVLTQEKALVALTNYESAFSKNFILIVDEIQNIERIKDEEDLRAKILYDTLIEFRNKKNIKQIIISGPRIKEIDELAENIFGNKALGISTSTSPVLNLTYSVKKIKSNFYFSQYCTLNDEVYKEKINDTSQIKGYGQKQYTDNYMNYLYQVINNLGVNAKNIIFAPTINTAIKVATYFANNEKQKLLTSELQSLIGYYQDTVNKNYAMCKVLKHGMAFHHGKLPMHVRRTLEKAISNNIIKNIICTTTLMQGVNLPTQNVIIRNPHLYINKTKELNGELSSYEMANLRGRAGRLLKDFIGRTYILDESGFENIDDYEQMEFFEDVTTTLPSSYRDRFEEYREYITDTINSDKPIDKNMGKYGYLISYIRQIILRYGVLAKDRLDMVGISLTNKEIKQINEELNTLKVGKEICYKNRYWDPFMLDYIYRRFKGEMPDSPKSRGAKARIEELMKFLRDNDTTKIMYEKYIPELYRQGINRSTLCKLCIEWACEKPLNEILVGGRYEGDNASENIDNTIELLQKTASFDIPLLLKPIFDMFKPDSIFLNCIQAGAYKKITRKIIEIGVPRETAIYLNNNLFENTKVNISEGETENDIRRIIRENFNELPYWIKVQLEFMI